MTKDIFTLTDIDDKKIEKIIHILPEKDFIDTLEYIAINALYFVEYNKKIETVINLSKGIFSKFDNDTINEKYIKFNIALSNLYSFLLSNFSLDIKDLMRAKLHPELKHSTYEEVKKWEIKYSELQALINDTEESYEDFLLTAKIELSSKQAEEKNKKYSDSNEDIILKPLGIKIKDNNILRGKEKVFINPTDKNLIYFLYYKSLSNKEECFTLDDLSKVEKKSKGYISNRITEINNKINKIISSKAIKLNIPKLIMKCKRGYCLNPKILHIKSK